MGLRAALSLVDPDMCCSVWVRRFGQFGRVLRRYVKRRQQRAIMLKRWFELVLSFEHPNLIIASSQPQKCNKITCHA